MVDVCCMDDDLETRFCCVSYGSEAHMIEASPATEDLRS